MSVQQVTAGPLAVAKGIAHRNDLPQVIRMLFDKVYGELPKTKVKQTGQNVILYVGSPEAPAMDSPEGMLIEAGVQVAAPFTDGGALISSATPAGNVATVAYYGPYDKMAPAYDALNKWCADNGYKPSGTSWEIYGDWEDDPAKLRTDIYLLLA
ncbi:MAG TPA: GyrI-like domain-containing protein [Anaerolineae bacterium]